MLLGEILQKTTDFFKEKKIESARLDAELLIAEVLKLKRIELYIKFETPLTDDEIQRCRDFVRRRSLGEPVAYILERKDFYNETFKVTKGVLIPRPETEGLVEEVLAWTKKNSLKEIFLADFGSGSGCVGLSILKEHKQVQLTGIDASEVAVKISQENASIVANPPYIAKDDPAVQTSVKAFEPGEALFAEDEGFREISEWAKVAGQVLRKGGLVAFEIGATQAEKAKKIFADTSQFALIRSAKDLAGLDRFIFAEKS